MDVHNQHVTVAQTLARFAADGSGAAHALGHCLDACLHGLQTSHFGFCFYGAIAAGSLLQALYALRDQKPHHARAHGLASLVNALEAFLRLHL